MDVGIDLVARERGTGDYWAIQCKFYDPDHALQKGDIDSFFTASGKRFATSAGERSFSHRLIISTTDKNDPNGWCAENSNPRYIVDLLKRIVRVSLESVRIVKSLPPMNEYMA